jgi:hypothetical protein
MNNYKYSGCLLNLVDAFEGANESTVEIIFEYKDSEDVKHFVELMENLGVNVEVCLEDKEYQTVELLVSTKLPHESK